MAPFADFMDYGFRPTEANSIELLVSPLNALIRDQVMWFESVYFKGDRVALDGSLI